jgi:hypothetical protein
MLLEALVACAGVTLKAVATALDIPVRSGTVSVEGDLDFRGIPPFSRCRRVIMSLIAKLREFSTCFRCVP